MAELLLINPRGRRKGARKSAKRRRVSTVARAAAPARRRRRRNPISVAGLRRRVVRRVGVAHRRIRRRRNPISLGRASTGMVAMFKQAAIGGVGTVAFDVLMGFVNKWLPASMQRSQTGVGVGDAVKAGITVLVGNALAKHTKGLSRQMALGSLTVQVAEIARAYLPASLPVAGIGYAVPARVTGNGASRIGPNRVGAFVTGNPLLSAYPQGGGNSSPMLSGTARQREGITQYR